MDELFLSRFTPSQMSHETLERIFVQREEFLGRRLEQLREGLLTPARRYTLLIGPRGIGKTHLVSLIYHRIREMEDLRDQVCIGWLREEEWGATTFLTFLIRVLRALAREGVALRLDDQIHALFDHDPSTAERLARELLLEVLGDRVLLLLLENLDELFRQMGAEGQRRLRAFLQETASTTILATAQSLSDDIRLQTSPFYGFFTVYHLEELTLEEASALLVRIAEAQGKPDLVQFIHSPEGQARLRALRHLAGGNHRVYVIFSQFLSRESLQELTVPFLRMVDDLTPYFQDRMRVLSPQQRQIVELLCERRGALPVKEIARWCFITPQVAASQLKELRDKAYVVTTPIGRESFYELREPLMRLCIETKTRGEGPIRLLVDFLRLWHTPSEIRARLMKVHVSFERCYLEHALIPAESDSDPEVQALCHELEDLFEERRIADALPITERLIARRGNARDWFWQGCCLDAVEQYEEAIASYDRGIELNPEAMWCWESRGASLSKLHRFEEAAASFGRVLQFEPEHFIALVCRGISLHVIGKHEDAIRSFELALQINPEDATVLQVCGRSLQILGQLESALALYQRALTIDPADASTWNCRASCLARLDRLGEAETSALNAIQIDSKSFENNFNLFKIELALGKTRDGLHRLDLILSRNSKDDRGYPGRLDDLLVDLICRNADDIEKTRAVIEPLIDIYGQHQALDALGMGVVLSILALSSSPLDQATVNVWRDIWVEVGGSKPELEIPLRLLDAAVRWRESHDPRILLSIAPEERQVLESLLPASSPPVCRAIRFS